MFNVIQVAALSSGVELSPLGMNDTGEIERGIGQVCKWFEWRRDRDLAEFLGECSS